MRVWLVKIGEPLPTQPGARRLRTAMLADELVARGHEVVWWTGTFDHFQRKQVLDGGARVQVRDGYELRALRGRPYKEVFSPARYLNHLEVARSFRRRAPGAPAPDAIVASMPDYHLAAEAVRYARARGIPCLVDVRDPWPDLFTTVGPRLLRPLLRLALAPDQRKLRRLLRDADGVLANTESLLAWALAKAGRQAGSSDRVFYLGAPPAAEASRDSPAMAALRRKAAGRFAVAYLGTFGRVWHPAVVVEAARLLADGSKSPPLFLVAGDGDAREDIERRARGLENVVLTGWLGDEDIRSLLSMATVAALPCNVPTDQFPNKAFSYLSAGLPVVSSLGGDLARLLDRHGAGVTVANEPGSMASVLRSLQEQPGRVATMRAAARALFDERLRADRIYADYADHVERIAGAA